MDRCLQKNQKNTPKSQYRLFNRHCQIDDYFREQWFVRIQFNLLRVLDRITEIKLSKRINRCHRQPNIITIRRNIRKRILQVLQWLFSPFNRIVKQQDLKPGVRVRTVVNIKWDLQDFYQRILWLSIFQVNYQYANPFVLHKVPGGLQLLGRSDAQY